MKRISWNNGKKMKIKYLMRNRGWLLMRIRKIKVLLQRKEIWKKEIKGIARTNLHKCWKLRKRKRKSKKMSLRPIFLKILPLHRNISLLVIFMDWVLLDFLLSRKMNSNKTRLTTKIMNFLRYNMWYLHQKCCVSVLLHTIFLFLLFLSKNLSRYQKDYSLTINDNDMSKLIFWNNVIFFTIACVSIFLLLFWIRISSKLKQKHNIYFVDALLCLKS